MSGQSGTTDATALTQSLTWAGSCDQVARTLDFSLVVSVTDKRLPAVSCALGDRVRFYRGGDLLFDGFVFSRQRDTGSDTVEIGCADRGLYLKRNQACYVFAGQTPETITRRVCGEFGIRAGELCATGVAVTRMFPEGTSLYQVIQTAYTLASAATGERYILRFRGEKLEVAAKRRGADTPVLQAGSSLVDMTVTESTEQMVNQVVIRDEHGAVLTQKTDEEAVALYGLMQAVVRKAKDADPAAEAAKLLSDNGVSQKITVTNLGNPSIITGNCVVLREPVTGLYGLFWIDSDSHVWKNGLYQNRLVLNFRNLMDEQEAGSPPRT